ncbi:MAG: hypothetical protein HYW49_01630 [Deltaproteobacteria bacterium]|nr:hypothetical protein [Deltaproteobacteria bacterium]
MTLSEAAQEWIVIAAAAAAALYLLRGRFRSAMAGPVSAWLLRNGRVGLAMRIRHQKSKAVWKMRHKCCN